MRCVAWPGVASLLSLSSLSEWQAMISYPTRNTKTTAIDEGEKKKGGETKKCQQAQEYGAKAGRKEKGEEDLSPPVNQDTHTHTHRITHTQSQIKK